MKIQNPAAPMGEVYPYRKGSVASISSKEGTPLFDTIPPERLGLHGEYDYHGLAKRVSQAFKRRFGENSLNGWAIAQRGGIVTVRGRITSAFLLYQFIELALRMEGAVGVDVNGNTIFPNIDLHRVPPLPPVPTHAMDLALNNL